MVASSELVPPESGARFPASWLRSRRLTEPPRPLRRWGTNPSARLWRAPPLSGEALQECRQKAPSAEGAVSRSLFRLTSEYATLEFNQRLNTSLSERLTEDKPLPWEFLIAAGKERILFHHPRRGWSPPFCGRGRGISPLRRRGGGRSLRAFAIAPCHPFGSLTLILGRNPHWQVAAALSAAVTTTKLIGERPHSQAEPTMQKQPTQTPAAFRERSARGLPKGPSLSQTPSSQYLARSNPGGAQAEWEERSGHGRRRPLPACSPCCTPSDAPHRVLNRWCLSQRSRINSPRACRPPPKSPECPHRPDNPGGSEL